MKLSSLTYLALCGAILASCKGNKASEEVPAGIVDPFDYTLTVNNIDGEDSTFVYLYDYDAIVSSRNPAPEAIIDSVMVANSTAVFTVNDATTPVVILRLGSGSGFTIFPEAGDNSYDVAERKGSGALAQKYAAYNDTIRAIYEMAEAKAPAPKTPEYKIFADSVNNLISLLKDVTLEENLNNGFGYYLLSQNAADMTSAQLDSILAKAPRFANANLIQNAKDIIQKYEATSAGCKYTDFTITNESGDVSLSQYVKPGQYTLVDFWASWCPWCIKGLPALKEIYNDYKDKGLILVGVAVRDEAEATKGAVEKYEITWPVIYNAERKPYEIYGMTGIPHLMLIGPNGKIVSRGEGAKKIRERLEQAFSAQ